MTLANKLTILRIVLIPPVVVCLTLPGRGYQWAAAAVFLLAALTDYLDGYLSRSRNEVSRLGKLLDPMADKLLIAAVFITLVELGRVPAWMVIVVVVRELAVTSLRAMAAAEGLVVPADTLGKWKMVAQIVAAITLMLQVEPLGAVSLWVAVILTIWSGVDYVRRYWFLFDEPRR